MQGTKLRAIFAVAISFTIAIPAIAASESASTGATFLNASQIAAFRESLSAGVRHISSQPFSTKAAEDAALIAMVQRTTVQEIRSAGPLNAGVVTSVVIAVGASGAIRAADIGSALGNAVQEISLCTNGADSESCRSAKEIAKAVANEGTPTIVAAFVEAVRSAGGSRDIISIALGTPEVTAVIPGTVRGHPAFGNVVPPLPPPPCNNPSCT